MKFHEIRFPEDISFGASGGPQRKSEIIQLANGIDHINIPWSKSLRRYNAATGIKSLDDLAQIVNIFEYCNGAEYGFRWKDWTDFKSSNPSSEPTAFDQKIGEGDGLETKFHLQKQYGFGAGAYWRRIVKPVDRTIQIAVDENIVREHIDYLFDAQSGQIEFAIPPTSGAPISAGFEFDVPVRFDMDDLSINITHFEAGEIQNIEIKELMGWS